MSLIHQLLLVVCYSFLFITDLEMEKMQVFFDVEDWEAFHSGKYNVKLLYVFRSMFHNQTMSYDGNEDTITKHSTMFKATHYLHISS